MAEEIVGVKIQVDASDVNKSVGDLRKKIIEAEAQVKQLTEAYGEQSREAIQAQKTLSQLQDLTNQKIENQNKRIDDAAKTVSALSAAYGGVQGALELTGLAGEDTIKQLAKIQSALAIGDAVQNLAEFRDAISSTFGSFITSLKSSSAFQKVNNALTATSSTLMKAFGLSVDTTAVSFKVLKGAIAATGIGLLVVAVGELVSAFQNYQSAAERAKKAQDDLNESANKGAKVAFDAEVAFLERQKQLDIAKAKNKGATEKELFDIEQQYANLKIKSQERFNKESRATTIEDQIQQERDLKKQQNDIEVAELNFQTSQNQKKKEQKEKDKKEREDKKKQDDADRKARKEQQYNDFVQFVNDLKASTDAEIELQEFLISEQKRKEQELFDWRVDLAQQRYDESEAEFAFMQELNKKKIEDDQKVLDAKVAIQMAEIDLVLQLSGVLKQVAGNNKAIQAAAIIAENAAGIGKIIINTKVANAKAVAANPIALGQPWVTINTISGALGVASSILATRNALSQLGAGGSAGSAPSLGGVGGSAPLAPSAPQAQLTQLNQASINQMGSAAGRAYVVESDITNQQEKIIRINRAARLG